MFLQFYSQSNISIFLFSYIPFAYSLVEDIQLVPCKHTESSVLTVCISPKIKFLIIAVRCFSGPGCLKGG